MMVCQGRYGDIKIMAIIKLPRFSNRHLFGIITFKKLIGCQRRVYIVHNKNVLITGVRNATCSLAPEYLFHPDKNIRILRVDIKGF